MSDEQPVDLRGLEPRDTDDHAKAAIRRFRWHVVLLTTLVIVVIAVGAIWGTSTYLRQRNQQRDEISTLREWAAGPESQAALIGGQNCETPTYKVGYAEVTVLQTLKYDGGWLLHLVVQGNGHPLATGEQPGTFQVFHTMMVVPATPGAIPAKVRVQDTGWTSGESYVQVPATSPTVSFRLVDSSGSQVGTFNVNMGRMRCG